MTDNATFNRWNGWITSICSDVQGLLTSRHIYHEVQKVIAANPRIHQSSSFYEWMAHQYVISSVIGIRRQIDADARSTTLVRLLQAIIREPRVLSRKRFLAHYTNYSPDFGNRGFDELAGKGAVHVDPVKVCEQLAELRNLATPIKAYANKRIAHLDQSELDRLPTYGNLDACLDYMEELLKHYLLLMRAETHAQIVPTWVYDWQEIFRHPWINSSPEQR